MRIERAELRDAARQIMEGLGPNAAADAAWEAIRDAGFPALTVAEAFGGLEQPLAAASWLYLELGRARSAAALLPSLLAAEALNALPAAAARDEWLGRIAGGERIAVSLVDPMAADVRLGAGDGLSGTVTAVQGASADHMLVAAPALLAIVPIAAARIVPRQLWDTTRDLADVILSDAAGRLLARGAEADRATAALSAHLHFAIAADCIGAADAILEQTVDYLKQRRQFDRPLAMFQALKHRCADLKTMIAAADALLADHLARCEAGGDALTLARGAKSIGSTTFRAVAEEAIQLHGGMGMTMEHPAHLYLKRALLNEHLASADDACDLAVADALIAAV